MIVEECLEVCSCLYDGGEDLYDCVMYCIGEKIGES